jgi:hypothetical protein
MGKSGWTELLAGAPWFQGPGQFPIAAYSEYLPPPRPGAKPYGPAEPLPRVGEFGWQITEYEETLELRPGLEHLAHCLLGALIHLGKGNPAHGISRNKCTNNPYWPPALADRAGRLKHERYVVLLPMTLSRTQDDKGRVRWTFFGGSEQGPAKVFWKSFFRSPRQERDAEEGLDFFRRLLHAAYLVPLKDLKDLRRAGFRILLDDEPLLPYWKEGPLPRWAAPLLWSKGQPLRSVRYLLTFRPFSELSPVVQQEYLQGHLHLLPFPGSLLFWGVNSYLQLQRELPLALQIPLLNLASRHEGWLGLRVPQSGWLHEPHPDHPEPHDHFGPVRNTYKRSHRWARLHRHEDETAVLSGEDKLMHVIFSTAPDDLGLYGKPMARNVQIWTTDNRLVLDGPLATAGDIVQARHLLHRGGLFGYRFQFPAMRIGRHEIYWHRPLVAYRHPQTGKPAVLPDAPLGYLTAYSVDKPDLKKPIEFWPCVEQRPGHSAAVTLFDRNHVQHPHQTTFNVRKLLDTWRLFGEKPLPRSLARQLLTLPRHETLEQWLDALSRQPAVVAQPLLAELDRCLEPPSASVSLPEPLTYHQTARRSFEVTYWKTIARLATGRYRNKDNADCVRDPVTRSQLARHQRDLEALGDYLLDYYRKLIADYGLEGKALAGELPFHWRTDFDFSWSGGWLNNQQGKAYERNLMVVIPGRDRGRAVIMGDHYDTAYMVDHYEPEYGGNKARLAAAGADDNHSATAALMLGAPLFLELSKAGRLGCDIWLIHLTGEEFPSDCLGARDLSERLIEGTLQLHLAGGKKRAFAKTRVQGLYVLDMVAHNNDRDKDVFQIAPGTGPYAMWLAYQAHLATAIWNAHAPTWNARAARKGCGRGRRCTDGKTVPAVALHPHLSGEVRPPYDPRSTLYNTDGQVFSDAGIAAVLFMENYDINRAGYHDSHDTMENIDLDYGAAVAAIAIESVARAATETPPV